MNKDINLSSLGMTSEKLFVILHPHLLKFYLYEI